MNNIAFFDCFLSSKSAKPSYCKNQYFCPFINKVSCSVLRNSKTWVFEVVSW